jgi:hypothetical protein
VKRKEVKNVSETGTELNQTKADPFDSGFGCFPSITVDIISQVAYTRLSGRLENVKCKLYFLFLGQPRHVRADFPLEPPPSQERSLVRRVWRVRIGGGHAQIAQGRIGRSSARLGRQRRKPQQERNWTSRTHNFYCVLLFFTNAF